MFSDLVEGGMEPEDAVDQVAAQLQAEQQANTLGNTPDTGDIQNLVAGTPQAAQMGEMGSEQPYGMQEM